MWEQKNLHVWKICAIKGEVVKPTSGSLPEIICRTTARQLANMLRPCEPAMRMRTLDSKATKEISAPSSVTMGKALEGMMLMMDVATSSSPTLPNKAPDTATSMLQVVSNDVSMPFISCI